MKNKDGHSTGNLQNLNLHEKKEIETIVNRGKPVYLTKNGYGALVVLSLEEYANLTDFGEFTKN